MSEILFLYCIHPLNTPQPSVQRDAIDVALSVGRSGMAGRELVATILSDTLQLQQLAASPTTESRREIAFASQMADLNKSLRPGVHGFGLGASPILLRFQLDRHSTKYTNDAGQFVAGGLFWDCPIGWPGVEVPLVRDSPVSLHQ